MARERIAQRRPRAGYIEAVAQVPMEAFEEGTEIVRVYLAASLPEAQAVEAALSDAGVDFAVEVEAIASRSVLLFPTTRQAAGFWIREDDVEHAAGALERAGHVAGLVLR
jgi:hypothetical protein